MIPFFRFAAALAFAAGVTLPLAAPAFAADAAQEQATLKALYEDARRAGETQVAVYTVYPHFQPMWDEFAREFPGIKVSSTVIPGGGAPLFGRIAAEKTSGNHAGDLLIIGTTDLTILIQDGSLQPYAVPTSNGLDDRYRDPRDYFQIPLTTIFNLIYNTTLVADDEVPNSLDEILQPKWKGKFGYARFTGTAAPDIAVATLIYNNAISDAQLRAIKDNGQLSPNNAALLATVAQGRVALALWGPTHSAIPIQADGAPIKFKFLADSAVISSTGVAILKDAPHLAATKLLDAWLYTAKGQEEIAVHGHMYGTMAGAPLPPGSPATPGYHFTEPPLDKISDAFAIERQKTLAIWGQ